MHKKSIYAVVFCVLMILSFNTVMVSAETPKKTILDVIGEDASLVARKKEIFQNLDQFVAINDDDIYVNEMLSAGIDSFVFVPYVYYGRSPWTFSKETIKETVNQNKDNERFFMVNKAGKTYRGSVFDYNSKGISESNPKALFLAPCDLNKYFASILKRSAQIKKDEGTFVNIKKVSTCSIGSLCWDFGETAFCETDYGNYVVWVEDSDEYKKVQVATEENFRRIAEAKHRAAMEQMRKKEEAEELEEIKQILIKVFEAVAVVAVAVFGVILTVLLVKKKKGKAEVAESFEK